MMMEFQNLETSVITGVLVFCVLLLVFSVVRHYCQHSRIPYAIWLLGLGTLVGLGNNSFDLLPAGVTLAPPVVFFVLLPILLFDSATKIRLSSLRSLIVPISFFASGGVIISLLVATGGFLLFPEIFPPWGILDLLLLGGVLSATDPVAIGALFKTFPVPEKLALLIEGESLFNDGTVVVLFTLFWSLIGGAEISVSNTVSQFGISILGGLFVGYIIGSACEWVLKRWKEEHPPFVVLTLSIVITHGTFLIADHLFHVSGVLAVVIVGILFGNRSLRHLSEHRRHFVSTFWDYAAFVSNSLLFFVLGIEFAQHSYNLPLISIPIAIAIFMIARAVAVYSGSGILRLAGTKIPPSWQHVMNIGGLRGALSIALILSLPIEYEYRILFLCLAHVVIVSSLTLNVLGLTMYLKKKKVG